MNLQLAITRREANIWGSLLIDLTVAAYYFGSVASTGLNGNLLSPALAAIVIKTIVLAIAASIVVFGAICALTMEELADERDGRFLSLGNTAGYYVLLTGVVAVAGYIAITSVANGTIGTAANAAAGASYGLLLHFLLIALILASVSRSAVQLYFYRKGL